MSGSTGGQLPSGWSWTSLAHVSNLLSGNPAPQGKEKFRESGPSFVRVQDMGRLGTRMRLADTKDHLAESVAKSLRLFPAGSVLFTKSGASTLLNQRAVLQRPMYVVSHIAAAIPEKGILSEWLYHWLSTVDFSRYAHATTLPSLPFSKIKHIAVPVAPRTEQTRIADTLDELFSGLEAGVAALKRARDRLQLYRASVLKAAVEGTLTVDWRKQHPNAEPASELLKRILVERRRHWEEDQLRKFEEKGKAPPKNWKAKYKEPVAPDTARIPSLPEGWCWATVDQCSLRIRYGSSAKTNDASTGIPVLRMGNLTSDGRLLFDKLKYLPSDHYEFPDLLLTEGDVLFNRTNSAELVGKAAVYSGVPHPCSFASYLIQVRLLPGISPEILTYALNGGLGRAWIKAVVNQTVGQANVNGTKLAAFTFPLPPATEQEAAIGTSENQLSVIEQLEADIDAKLQSAQTLRQSILKHAFTGKLVPQDPHDEPAAKLLKRIAAERTVRTRQSAAAKNTDSARRRRQRAKTK